MRRKRFKRAEEGEDSLPGKNEILLELLRVMILLMFKKYVICNGNEGNAGTFMDRSIMEGDPHKVLEGMAIAAYVCWI